MADRRWLSAKAMFPLAISSAKPVGELNALFITEGCIQWPGVTMWPNPSFLPKKLSAYHDNQPICLAVFATQSGVEVPNDSLFPIRVFRQYIDVTVGFCKTDALTA